LRWTAAAATGNNGSAMGGRTSEQSQWAMRWWWGKRITADAEVAQWEFVFDLFLFFAKALLLESIFVLQTCVLPGGTN
jgi:hypothetical protein